MKVIDPLPKLIQPAKFFICIMNNYLVGNKRFEIGYVGIVENIFNDTPGQYFVLF